MSIKFVEEFERLANGKFPMIKFQSADYIRKTEGDTELEIKFMISPIDIKNFTEDQKQEVESIVSKIVNTGIKVNVTYVKAFADEKVVKNKIIEFLNSNNSILLKEISDDNLKISVDEQNITIDFTFDTPIYLMVSSIQFLDPFKDYLDMNFTQNIIINITEKKGMKVSEYTPRLIQQSDDVGLITVNNFSMVYGRRGIKGIAEMPTYIVNASSRAGQNCVLCGKVSEFIIKEYKNKKYDSNNPKSGPEMKKLVSFNINDTTGRINCVIFPEEKDIVCFSLIHDGDEVLVKGQVQDDMMNKGKVKAMIDAIGRCDIDYSSIKYKKTKDLPLEYQTVSPQPYNDPVFTVASLSLLDDQDVEVPSLLKDKTYVIFDLETTGLDTAKDEIIEIGACKMVNGLVTETFQTLVKPSKPIPPQISEITHITNDMVQYCPPISKILPDFLLFCKDYTLVGHNIGSFDFPFVENIARKYSYKFNNETFDTIVKAKELLPNRKGYRLTELSADYHISHNDAHRALADVLATAEVLKILAVEMDKR